MKKVLGLVLGLTLGLTSCSDEEVTCEVIYPTTDVRLDVNASSSNITGRDVNRDDIPATVDAIDVTISSSVTPIERNEVFNMVDDGSGETGFVIESVALGLNDVIATTTTVANGSFNVSQFSTNTFTPQEKLDDNKSKVPYAVYIGTVNDVEVTGLNDFITVPMTTQNGRLNTVVIMEESIRNDFHYEVVSWTTSEPATYLYPSNSSKGVSLYWSDENSIGGETQSITINVFASDNTFVYGSTTLLNVTASTGLNTILTINATDVEAETVGFDFTFQEWVEVDGN